MTLIDLLNKYDIPYKLDENNENVFVDDLLLIPYEEEIRDNLPDFEFIWNHKRYKIEPNHRYCDE